MIRHFLSAEWLRMGVPLDAVAAAGGSPLVIGPDTCRLLSNKSVLAVLSEGTVPLSADERAFVARHVPWTRLLREGTVCYDGRDLGVTELTERYRERLVLKPAGGFGGQQVVMGFRTGPQEWRAHVRDALSRGDCVVQEIVEPDPLEMDFYDARTRRVTRQEVSYVLGPYLVAGEPHGYKVRHTVADQPAVVNVQFGAAFNVAF